MTKINTSKIEGYADMTLNQKVAALEAAEYEDNASELKRYKNAASKANGEAAEWKRKYKALLSEKERNQQASEEALNILRKKVEDMEKEKRVSGHKMQLLALGYDEALADKTAKAMGDIATVFANQKNFLESRDKAYQARRMGQTPTPPCVKYCQRQYRVRKNGRGYIEKTT